MASMDESPPGEWTGRTPKTASANDQLDTENELKKGPVPRPPKAPATPNSRQPGGKASRDPKETSAAVEADPLHGGARCFFDFQASLTYSKCVAL